MQELFLGRAVGSPGCARRVLWCAPLRTLSASATLFTYVPALAVLVFAWTGGPFLSPDSFESVAAGRCMLGLAEPSCEDIEWYMWPPVFPLVAGGLSAVLDIRVAALVTSLAATALLAFPVARLATALGRPAAGPAAVILVFAIPGVHFHALGGDARPAAILAISWAWALVLERRRAGWAGALAALALLCRPEATVAAALVLLWVLVRWRAGFRGALAGFAALALPWWALLSWTFGRPTIVARSWEFGVLHWLDVVPRQWMFQLLGIGTGGSSLRDALIDAQASPFDFPLAVVVAGLPTVAWAVLRAVPVLLWPLAAVGIVTAAAWRQEREALAAVAGLALPAVAAAALPQAQQAALSESNLLPLLVAVGVCGGAGAAWVGSRLGHWSGALVVAVAVALLGLGQAVGRMLPSGDARGVVTQTARWLEANTTGDARIAASFDSGAAIHLAARHHVRLPSPWRVEAWASGPSRPHFLVLSNPDAPWVQAALGDLAQAGPVDAVFTVRTESDWMTVLRLGAPAGPGGEHGVGGALALPGEGVER